MKTNIRILRNEKGFTQLELAKRVDVSESMISQYETGKKMPSYETLLKLGEALECSVSDILDERKTDGLELTGFEKALVKKYRALDDHGRELVDAVLDIEYTRCAKPVKEERKVKVIPLFPAATGPGEPMETTAFQEHEVDANSTAQFAVRISGDSMEPELHDGEVVLCVRRRAQIGELAVIMVNGFLYVKQYIADSFGNIYLRSLNRQRKDLDVDIMASGNDTVTGYGVVIHRHVPLVRE